MSGSVSGPSRPEATTSTSQLAEDGSDRTTAAYRENYGRLAEIKRTYDPDTLFRVNRNIRPA